MGKSKKNTIADIELPKKRGRLAGAKTYNKQTLYKLVTQYIYTNAPSPTAVRLITLQT